MNDQDHPTQATRTRREAEAWYMVLENPDLNDRAFSNFLEWQQIPTNQEAFDAESAWQARIFHAREQSPAANADFLPPRLTGRLTVAIVGAVVAGIVVWVVRRALY